MATRFYLRNLLAAYPPTTGEKSTALPVDTLGANNAAGTDETRALKTAIGTLETSLSKNSDAQTAARDNYLARFTSDPLAGTSITAQTWTIALALAETNAAANSFLNLSVYIWRPSNNTVVGFIYDSHTNLGAEWAATKAGRVATFSGAAVTYVAGDVLVVEVWRHAAQSMANAYAQIVYFDGTVAVTEGSTTSAGSYLETPQNLTFVTNIVKVTNETMEIVEVIRKVTGPVKRVNETVNINESSANKTGLPLEEICFGGTEAAPSAPSGRWVPLISRQGAGWGTDEQAERSVIPGTCTLKNFRVRVDTAPGSGNNYTFTLYKNGSATAVQVVLTDSETTDIDLVNTLSLVRGDEVSVQCTTNLFIPILSTWSFLLVHLYPKETFFMAAGSNNTNNEYNHMSGADNNSNTDEEAVKSIFSVKGVIRNLILRSYLGISGGTIGRTIRKNGVDTDLTVSFSSGDSGEDNVHGVFYDVGTDLLTGKSIRTGSPNDGGWQDTGLIFELMSGPDRSQVIIGIGNRRNDLSGVRYHALPHFEPSGNSGTDNLRSQRPMAAARKVSKLYVKTLNFWEAGFTCVITVQKNGVNTALTATLSDSVKEASDLVNDAQFADGDLISIKTDLNPTGGIVIHHIQWSVLAEKVGLTLVKVINETLDIPEAKRRVLGPIKKTNESVDIPEAKNKVVGVIKANNETVNIPEVRNKFMTIIKLTEEIIEFIETGRKVVGLRRTNNETVNIPETAHKALGFKKITNEIVNIVETAVKRVGIIKIKNEIQEILETRNKRIDIKKITNEPIEILETSGKRIGIVKKINEFLNIPETIAKRIGTVKVTNEVVAIPEFVKKVITIVKVTNEIVNIPETGRRLLGILKKISEIINIPETILKILSRGVDIDIYVTLNDKDTDITVILNSVEEDMRTNLNSVNEDIRTDRLD